jgi:glucose-6-phosphate 1-dehydrogenase
VSAPLLADLPIIEATPVGSLGPESVHDLVAPHGWRLPFERRWRDSRAAPFV